MIFLTLTLRVSQISVLSHAPERDTFTALKKKTKKEEMWYMLLCSSNEASRKQNALKRFLATKNVPVAFLLSLVLIWTAHQLRFEYEI